MSEPADFIAGSKEQIERILAEHIRYAVTILDSELDLEDVACAVDIKVIGQRHATAALIKWFTDQLVYQAQGRAKRVDDWLFIRLNLDEKVSIDRLWARELDEADGELIQLTVTKLEVTE